MNVIASPRISRLLDRMADAGLAALLVTKPVNLKYLLDERDAAGGAYLISPDRRVAIVNRGLLEQPSFGAGRGEPADLLSALRALDYYSGAIGYDDTHLSAGELAALQAVVGDRVAFHPALNIVEVLREIKDTGEIRRIAEAARLTDAVLDHLATVPWTGKTEVEMALTVEAAMLELGADSPAFPSIVAGSPRNGLVHTEPTTSVLSSGAVVLVHIGARLDGYASDCTRMFSIGRPRSEFLEVYNVIREAQRVALQCVGPAADASALELQASVVLAAAGLDGRFPHDLGHGVGLDSSEGPHLSQHRAGLRLAPGNVLTIEPGVYVPERYGMRIGDLVAVTSDGRTILSSFPRDAPAEVT